MQSIAYTVYINKRAKLTKQNKAFLIKYHGGRIVHDRMMSLIIIFLTLETFFSCNKNHINYLIFY